MIEYIAQGLSSVAKYIIPLLLVGIPFYALAVKKVKVYEVFVVGAKDGFTIAVRIIPYLVAILVAVGMFRASGALDLLLNLLTPVLNLIGFPPENLPLALMRPLSGSGSLRADRLPYILIWVDNLTLFSQTIASRVPTVRRAGVGLWKNT